MSDTETEEKQFEVEIAKNGRAGCKKCKQKCQQGEIRIAKLVANPFGEGKMKSWHHLDCMFEVFKKQRATTKRIEDTDDMAGYGHLNDDDKETIKQKISELITFFGQSPGKKQTEKKPKKSPKNEKTNNEKPSKEEFNKDDNLFKTFQDIVKAIADHPSYLDKTSIAKKFFSKGTSGKEFEGDIEIWCRLLMPQSDKRIYNLQSKQLVKLFSRIFSEDQDEMLEHLEQGDIGETISTFYMKSRRLKPLPKASTITIQEVNTFLYNLSKLTKEDDQISHFEKIIRQLTADDLKTIIKLIKHDLRMGAGPKHILDGIHPDAYEVYKASKNLDDVVSRCFGNSKIQSADIKIMTPVFPMLAEACKSVEQAMKKCPDGMYSEIKYDGERVQVHKHGTDFKFFSRALKPVLPHKVAHFKDFIPKAFPYAKDLVLDSEILMMDTQTGKPLPFGTLGKHKKAEFKDASVCLFVFDCLYYNGESLLNKPVIDRKKVLQENMTEIPNHIVFSEAEVIDKPKDLARMIAKVLQQGLEGLVLKPIMSKYEPGKRHWLKVKKDYLFDGAMADSADLIVLGAWYGTGKKGGMMSVFLMGCYIPFSKKFCTVTKVHTGHDDKTLEKIQGELKMEKISCDPDKVPSWLKCTRSMVPDFVAVDPKNQPVWEITGAEFTQHDVHTADGISIRFPRVTKIRNDKDWKTATNLDELKVLYKKSKENTDVSLLMKGIKNKPDEKKRKKGDEDDEEISLFSPEKKRKVESNIGESSRSKNYPKKEKATQDKFVKNEEKQKVKEESNTSKDRNKSKVKIKDPLPEYFKGVKALFGDNNSKIEDENEIKRYFVAYGGILLNDIDWKKATHIVHFSNEVNELTRKYPTSAKHVNVNWIKYTIHSGKIKYARKYFVKWNPLNEN